MIRSATRSGRVKVKMFRITDAIREFFNYRYDDASFRLELAKLNGPWVPTQRDFRTRAERLADPHSEAHEPREKPDCS